MGHIYVCVSVTVVGDGSKDEGIEQGAVGGRVWSIWTVTGIALNRPFSLAIVGNATCQGVQVGGEGSVHSGESVRVANKDVTGWRAVNLPYFGRGFEERESGLPDPGGGRVSNVGDKTALANKSVVFPAGCGLKDR